MSDMPGVLFECPACHTLIDLSARHEADFNLRCPKCEKARVAGLMFISRQGNKGGICLS